MMHSLKKIGAGTKIMVASFASFAASAVLIHFIFFKGDNMKLLYAAERSEKLSMLENDPFCYTTAAFGSSHMHDGFDPRAFDQAFFGGTNGVKSFNLGIEAGCQAEQREVARHFLKYLETRGATNALVILELSASMNSTTDFLVHPRTINIYDLSTLRFAWSYSNRQIGFKRWLGRIVFALAGTGLHYANVGMLSNLIFHPGLNEDMIKSEMSGDRRGLDPLPEANKALVRATLATRPKQPAVVQGEIQPGNYELLSELQKGTKIRDVKFVYVVMPKLDKLSVVPEYPAEIDGPTGKVPVINFYDSSDLLLRPQLWHDLAHLDESGATLLSKLLGSRLRNFYSGQNLNKAYVVR